MKGKKRNCQWLKIKYAIKVTIICCRIQNSGHFVFFLFLKRQYLFDRYPNSLWFTTNKDLIYMVFHWGLTSLKIKPIITNKEHTYKILIYQSQISVIIIIQVQEIITVPLVSQKYQLINQSIHLYKKSMSNMHNKLKW